MTAIYMSVLWLVFILSSAEALICGKCADVVKPEACLVNTSCGTDQLCGVNQFMSVIANGLRYQLRCQPKLMCNVLSSTPQGNLCARCCDTDLCNVKPCEITTTPITTLVTKPTSIFSTTGSQSTTRTTQSSKTSTVITTESTTRIKTTPSTTKPTTKPTTVPTANPSTKPSTSTTTTQRATTTTTRRTTTLLQPPAVTTSKAVIKLNSNNPSDQFICTANNADRLNIYINNQNRIHLQRNTTTTITYTMTVKDWQNATIRCEGVNTKTKATASTDVIVTAFGTIPYFPISESREIIVRDGDNIGLKCIPEGNPTPVVTWNVPDLVRTSMALQTHISYHFDRVELELSNMVPALVGTYTCAAHNTLGTATYTYHIKYFTAQQTTTTTILPTITLLVKPDIFLEKQITVIEGVTTLAIPCTADGIPTPTISWGTAEGYMPSNIQQYANYLIIHNIDFYDSRYYVCIASNAAGTTKQVIHVLVKPKPHVLPSVILASNLQVKYGGRVTLKCNVSGYPEPNVTWAFNGVQTGRSKELVIDKATLTDIGAYSCSATNDVGTVTKTLVMLVTGTPPSIVTSQPTTITVNGNNPVVLKCQASGDPVPDITWTFKAFVGSANTINQSISRDKSTLTLTHVDKSGTAKCEASNPFGQVQASFSIIAIPQVFG